MPDIFRVGARRRDLIGIVSFVTECGARIEIRTDVEKRLKVAAITGFTAGDMESNWQATEVGLQVIRETATGAAKRMIMLPPLAPAAETWARTTVETNKRDELAALHQGCGGGA